MYEYIVYAIKSYQSIRVFIFTTPCKFSMLLLLLLLLITHNIPIV